MRALTLLALHASLALPGVAGAQPVFVPGDVDGAGGRAVGAAVRACGGVAPRILDRTRPAPPAADEQVIAAVSRARQLTLDAEFEQAIAALQALYLELAREPARAGTGRVWAEALTVDAFARWSRAGGPDDVPSEVAARLEEAVSLWPDVQVDESVMPPAVARALGDARGRRARRPTGEVVIDDARGATWAWVSGQSAAARSVLRPAGQTLVAIVDAWGSATVRLVEVRPAQQVRAAIGGRRRPPRSSPPPGAAGAIVVGRGDDGLVAQSWPGGRARVDVARAPGALAERLGLCGAGAIAQRGREGSGAATSGGGSGVVWYVLGAAAVIAGGVTAGVLLADEPVAEIRFHTEP